MQPFTMTTVGQLGDDSIGAGYTGGTKRPSLQLGAIAQLGERLDRTQEVAGSSPASSIENAAKSKGFFSLSEREKPLYEIGHQNWASDGELKPRAPVGSGEQSQPGVATWGASASVAWP